MSIASQLTALEGNISDAYNMVAQRGGTVPARKNMENLDDAIATIPSGGGQPSGIPRAVNSSGVYGKPTSSYSFSLPSGATSLEAWALYYAFYSSLNLTSVDMGSLTEITTPNAAYNAFYACAEITSVDLGSLETVSGVAALQNAFYSCNKLVNLDLSSLTTVSNVNAMNSCFASCKSLTTLDLSSLTTVSDTSAMSSCFSSCISITTVNLSSLTTISGDNALNNAFGYNYSLSTVNFNSLSVLTGSSALSNTFRNCRSLTSLSFPSLTTSSFGSYTNQFSNMLKSCSGVTVHFPAAIQSTISGWTDVTKGFGGTNTTVLFDL